MIEYAMYPNDFDAVYYVAANEEVPDEGLGLYAVVRDWSLSTWLIEVHGDKSAAFLIEKSVVSNSDAEDGWLARYAIDAYYDTMES